ncbi:unnamed protein product [Cyclocybe aegerita]|uniref:BRCA2 OB1 domain-containing protein n=1 Tax=Cyclocybe aegerita TaxID=1973307 RepID=A0A8S0X268_CYCAE|nr:unnamed protein product [Cyclocybe aegerita]
MAQSPSSSPARKRQRLSSPTYEVEDLTEHDLIAFDEIEARLSQENQQDSSQERDGAGFSTTSGSLNAIKQPEWDDAQPREPSSSFPKPGSESGKATGLHDDPDNPFSHGFMSAAKAPKAQAVFSSASAMVGFTSASALNLSKDYERSPSPEAQPTGADFEAWFKPASAELPAHFVAPTSFVGFTTAKLKDTSRTIIVPSKEALAKAQARIAAWEKEDVPQYGTNDENAGSSNLLQKQAPQVGFKSASHHAGHSPQRHALQSASSLMNTPATPSPAGTGFSRAGLPSSILQQRPTAFKSPLVKKVHSVHNPPFHGSPLNPGRPSTSLGFTTATSVTPLPLSNPPLTVPRASHPHSGSSSSLGFVTPLRPGTHTPASALRTRPARFVTPFKANMRPGGAGRSTLIASSLGRSPMPQAAKIRTPQPPQPNIVPREKPVPRKFFDLVPPPKRQTLETSGLQPQQFDDLESVDIDASTLRIITPDSAMYYTFHTRSSTPPPPGLETPTILGPKEALQELLTRGCTFATKPWVDNHWALILWKLAGMVTLEPEKESNAEMRRWCWAEVMRQLLYRYERELNAGVRPPLRKLANQDAPAAFPMVLCISNIIWGPGGRTEDGLPIEPHPEFELTDGWYRLRAQVDAPMARAARKGVLRVGRKLGIAGAKLSTQKKDPMEILEAYNSTALVLTGNSSHLMPWHAKLGFTAGPCVSTLHSLTSDGGLVAALDFVIIQTYSVAFLETVEDEKGQKERRGPWNEAEEMRVHEQWKRRREVEASKLRANLEKDVSRYEGYIDRLERKAGSRFQPTEDDCPPDSIESLYDELEYPDTAATLLTRISPTEAGWLALHIRKQTEKQREELADLIEKELQIICPPRDVRSFRLLTVQDARTSRRPANRMAQLTVWDVLSLNLDEGSKAGSFECGQRYLATNLVPTSPSAWMDTQPGSEIYLSTRRDTRWTKIRTVL